MNTMERIIPAISWLKTYKKEQLNGDLSAGLTVGVMLIPQGMAYALIAGLPPIYGLYASVVPIVIYALFGSSRQLAVGPVAMVSLLTASGVGALAAGGSEMYITLAILLAFMVGGIQFLLGVFRLGFLVNFLSHPVISGFTSAAALIIGLSQLKHLLGIDLARSHHVHEILIEAVARIGEMNLYTFAIGMAGILVIVLGKRLHKAIPGPLVVVVLGILAVLIFDLAGHGVKIVGDIPSGLPSFEIVSLKAEYIQDLLPVALAIALVSFMESIAVAKAVQARHRDYEVSANRELTALGLANIVGSFFQSYPTTGGFSRTAVNDQAGAKTGLASLISVALIILTLLFLTPLFYSLPKAILASIIMVAVFGLIDFKEAKYLWKSDRQDFWMLIVTFVSTLAFGIEQGIGIGVILSLAMIIYRTAYPHHAELGRVPGTDIYRNIDRFEGLEIRPDILVVRFDAQLYFANTDHFRNAVNKYIDGREERVRVIIINFDSINNIDSSAVHLIKDLVDNCRNWNIELAITGAKGPVRDKFKKSGLLEIMGDGAFFMSIQDAVDYHTSQERKEEISGKTNYAVQANTE